MRASDTSDIPSFRTPSTVSAAQVVGILLWLGIIAGGMWGLLKYSESAGEASVSPSFWPARSAIARGRSQPTLVMFVHPKCPCSRASLGELERIAARCQGKFEGRVVFFKPTEESENWARTDLWHSAEKIPGVTVSADENGLEASRFHATTSGHTVLYSPGGHLLFQGGITASRGHQGDNNGEQTVIALLEHGTTPSLASTPVFGCGLAATQECQSGGDALCKR